MEEVKTTEVPKPEQEEKKQVDQKAEDAKTKSHKGRLIIRNLVYDINEKHLRNLFKPFGEIQGIQLPINPATNKAKGFAFIEFDNKNIALGAIQKLNNTKFKGRTILLDLAVEKEKFVTQKGDQVPKKTDSGEAKKSKEAGDDIFKSKSHKSEEKMDEEEEEEEEDEGYDDEDEDEEEEDEEEDEDENEDEDDKEDGAEETKEGKDEENEEEDRKEDLNSTIFVKNISFDVGQSEFRDFFKKFGQLWYAKLVINRETEAHNGNGFVKFKSPEVAQYLIDESKKFEDDFLGLNSMVQEVSLELGGRRMIILPALARKEVRTLKETRSQKDGENAPRNPNTIEYWIYHDRTRKRNIYLAQCGLNQPSDTFTQDDKLKFEANTAEKVEKIKNPNYMISKTRVAFKNLPKWNFDENALKQAILKVLAQKHEPKVIKTRRLVSKTSIIREKERQDEEGNFRSRGFGFVDFTSHEDALFFLEKIKEDYSLLSKSRVPIVEFAIEDIRELKKREKILQKIHNKKEEMSKNTEAKVDKPEIEAKKNSEKLAKVRLEELLELEATDRKYEEVKLLMRKIKSRGLKQRLKKKVDVKYAKFNKNKQGNDKNAQTKSKIKAKLQRKQEEQVQRKANRQVEKKQAEQTAYATEKEEEKALIKNIKRMIQSSKKEKRKAEDHDEFDDITDAYKKKLKKV